MVLCGEDEACVDGAASSELQLQGRAGAGAAAGSQTGATGLQ